MNPSPHPTQIFLSNPTALRVEFRLDDAGLRLWWSPLAGKSTDCLDRNYSSRDAHLSVFASITLLGCGLGEFERCEYDPYHCVLRFAGRALHLALPVDYPAVLVWSDRPLEVDFQSHRFDRPLCQTPSLLVLRHEEPRHAFEFAAAAGAGGGGLRHCHFIAPEFPTFTQARLAARQPLAIGVGLAGERVGDRTAALAAAGPGALLAANEKALAPHVAGGRVRSARHPELAALRDRVIRGLHSMVDESGAFRASLKAIYYLLWVRDSGFAFAYQAAAGWPHKLAEVCRLILDNPTEVDEPGLPRGRMFGQLIHRRLGKLEEDGLFYIVWLLFTHQTQHGHLDYVRAEDWELIAEALAWVEAVAWDEGRGLFGEFTADETPAHGSRDHGWDYAAGRPSDDYCLRHEGVPVKRNYDIYFNLCMHSVYVMLAALRGEPSFLAKAERVRPELEKLLRERHEGVPVYGELLMADGRRPHPRHWGPPAGASCCVWGLALPNFFPLPDWDAVRAAVLDAIIAQPEMHFINGVCSALAAVDPWCYPEERCLAVHELLAAETNRPGKYLPMGGAMPEKFRAPEGNLYHDIRPQGFAMGAWLAAWSALGLRRLPHGLALRPTGAFEEIGDYPWRGKNLRFVFGPRTRSLALEIDGVVHRGTLQVPEEALMDGSVVRLVESAPCPLLLRSTVELLRVEREGNAPGGACLYHGRAFGLSRLTFSERPAAPVVLRSGADQQISTTLCEGGGMFHVDFTHFGEFVFRWDFG